MSDLNYESFSFDNAIEFFKDKVEAVIVADAKANRIRPLVKKGIFRVIIG